MSCSHPDLSGVALTDLDLDGVWFAECVLDDAVVRHTDLFSCKFAGCSMRRTDLAAGPLVKSEFVDSTLADARLDGANMLRVRADNTDFRGADLTGVTVTRMVARGCDLRGASLRNAKFRGTTIYHGTLVGGADLTGTSGTINGSLHINVGTLEAPHVLAAHEALAWMRDAGADLTWSHTPEEVARSRHRGRVASSVYASGTRGLPRGMAHLPSSVAISQGN